MYETNFFGDLDSSNTLLGWLYYWFFIRKHLETPLDPYEFADLHSFSTIENKKIAALAVTKGYLTVIEDYSNQNMLYKCKLTELGKKILTLYVMFETL